MKASATRAAIRFLAHMRSCFSVDARIPQGCWITADTALHWGLIIAAAALVMWIRLLPLSPGILDDVATLVVWQRRASVVAASLPPEISARSRATELRRLLDQWRQHHLDEFNAERKQVAARLRSELSYAGADGVQHIILGDYDSYHWLRMARNYLRMELHAMP
ncbi:MAG: hypothetical protein JO189_17710 [Deltaproteobacteria bacterium]|nr:hypothetical protein [Deltaproteobacteria bacterium]